MASIAIIDYGMGNLHSISKALQHCTQDSIQVTGDPSRILQADRVVLPGVGAMRDCMGEMQQKGLHEVALEAAQQKPFLGICVGMQALLSHSDENAGVACLNWLPGRIRHFPQKMDASGEAMKIPHMGWNHVHQQPHVLWQGIPQDSRFYFVHSYYLPTAELDAALVAGVTDYTDTLVSALSRENVFAVQFHPEKSQTVGLKLLENFARWDG